MSWGQRRESVWNYTVNINGAIGRRRTGHGLSVLDHGFLYGDGVFEGNADLRVVKIFKLEEHLQRLYESAKVLMLGIPWS
jgi:branched-chain amino acid aminotransferase